MPFADDLKFVMEDEDVAVYGQNLFIGTAAVIAPVVSGEEVASLHIIETGGTGALLVHNVLTPGYLQPGAQITGRHHEYQEAYDMAKAAYDACWTVRNQFVGSGEVLPWYLWVRPLQEPTDLGIGEDGRVRVGFNVLARMRP
jgi:hypothetical protein